MLLAMIMFLTIVVVHCFVSMCGMWYFMMLLVNLIAVLTFITRRMMMSVDPDTCIWTSDCKRAQSEVGYQVRWVRSIVARAKVLPS